jgi:hypothetical protein
MALLKMVSVATLPQRKIRNKITATKKIPITPKEMSKSFFAKTLLLFTLSLLDKT